MSKRTGGQTTEVDGEKWWLVLTESEKNKDKEWKHSCGSMVQGETCYYPIHDGPFPLSGSGRAHSETVPYCPKCEEKPRGHPISV